MLDFNDLEVRDRTNYQPIIYRRYSLTVRKVYNKYIISVIDNDNGNREVWKSESGKNKFVSTFDQCYDFYKHSGIIVDIDEQVKNEYGKLLQHFTTYPTK